MEDCKLNQDPSQTQLGRSPTGNLTSFRFNKEVARKELVRYIVVDEQPFSLCENDSFKRREKMTYGALFQPPSRNIVKADIFKFYKSELEKLKNLLQNTPGKISLTSDLWSTPSKLRFCCVTAHFLDSTWAIQKRIIWFRLLEIPHDGLTIASSVFDAINEYEISNNIFSISLDNVSSNDRASNELSNWLPIQHSGQYFHVRCCCHILNLMVKDGLDVCKDALENVRQTTIYLHSLQKRYQDFTKICQALSIKSRKPPIDVKHRWNSTYLMLNAIISLQQPITQYQMAKSLNHTISDDDWVATKLLRDFLKVFYDATLCFSMLHLVKLLRI
ncbi:hypothetical protein GIB67_022340 [Kingdonia uniflora]|uniref:Uncharacterized protein n=1 Tax=Kingdonia uniflora TaxID=39325 RepID=A0A7J7MI54_9MAGN|nr:hypothetical protein GIB67_022340 [Kingdonia uniflora]